MARSTVPQFTTSSAVHRDLYQLAGRLGAAACRAEPGMVWVEFVSAGVRYRTAIESTGCCKTILAAAWEQSHSASQAVKRRRRREKAAEQRAHVRRGGF